MERIMNARNFRKDFPTLTEPVVVISRERLIGRWYPASFPSYAHLTSDAGLAEKLAEIRAAATKPIQTQAQRDAILRKINKGG